MEPIEIKIASWNDGHGTGRTVSISDYLTLLSNRDTIGIAEFMGNSWYYNTFYFDDYQQQSSHPGFTATQMFRLCKLMISIGVYRNGWVHREKEMAFVVESLLSAHAVFSDLHGYEREFYKNICRPIRYTSGQEPLEGWQIITNGAKLYDRQARTVDCLALASALKTVLAEYVAQLRSAQWDDEIWRNFRRKLHSELAYWNVKGFETEET